MSDEGKVICEKAKAFVCDGIVGVGAKCSWHEPFITASCIRHYCPKQGGTIKTMPCEGEETK